MKFTCEVKKFDTFTRDLELVVELITVLAAIQLSKSVRSWYTQYLTDMNTHGKSAFSYHDLTITSWYHELSTVVSTL